MSQKQGVLIYGSGGHAKVICDIIESLDRYTIKGIIDDNQEKWGGFFKGYPILGDISVISDIDQQDQIILAIGDNEHRLRIGQNMFLSLPKIIHLSSIIGSNVTIKSGTVVMGNTIINVDSTVSEFCIVNSGVNIDHDCFIGKGVHIAPGSTLCGNVCIGENTLIGAGTVVIENIKIGKNCIIGAGSTIVKNIPDDTKVIGNKRISLD